MDSKEEGGEDPAQLAPPLTSDFGLDVHGLLFFGHSFACGAADGAWSGSPMGLWSSKVRDVRVSLLAFSEGAGEACGSTKR